MSTLVNWNGQQYLVPAYNDTGYAQGNGNLSQYLVAISTGSLQQVGGLFQLTADADFGPNFGLVSSYYKSRTANIASAGVLRLANTDAIKWRNSDNSADVTLAMNATGTAARTYTIPDIANSYFVMTEGDQTINGSKTFGSAIIGNLTGNASGNLLLTGGTMAGDIAMGGTYKLTGLAAGSTNGDSLRYEQAIGVFLPLAGGTMSGNIAMGGSYKLTGLAAGSSNGDSLRYEQVIGTYALDSAVVHNTGTENVAGAKTFTTQIIGKGTVTNDSASSGYIGEYVESVASATTISSSVVAQDITSITLSAGDWEITGMFYFSLNTATGFDLAGGMVLTVSGNNTTGNVAGSNYMATIQPNGNTSTSVTVAGYRASLSGSTTYYLKAYCEYSSGNPKVAGRISARRMR